MDTATDAHRQDEFHGGLAPSRALFEAAVAGDGDAYWQLVEPLLPKLYRGARAMCRNVSDAEDLTQETLLVGWRNLRSLRDPARLPAWLSTIQMRLALRKMKSSARVETVELDQVSHLLKDRDLTGFIDWLAGLEPTQRALLIMHFYYDQQIEDAARALHLKPSTLRSKWHRLLRRLRQDASAQ